MSESIQNLPSVRSGSSCAVVDAMDRRRFLLDAADLYGRPIDVDLAELDCLDDTRAVLLAFPWLSDPELLEALWALEARRRDTR